MSSSGTMKAASRGAHKLVGGVPKYSNTGLRLAFVMGMANSNPTTVPTPANAAYLIR